MCDMIPKLVKFLNLIPEFKIKKNLNTYDRQRVSIILNELTDSWNSVVLNQKKTAD